MKKALQFFFDKLGSKTLFVGFCLICSVMLLSNPIQAQHEHHTNSPLAQQDTIKGSIQREVHQLVGKNHFTLNYYSPAVRRRMIWGGLVAYDQVWVTGAHRATNVEFTQAIRIDGKVIPAGKYAFFTIPGKKNWTLILNTRWDQHLADEYNAVEDVIRMDVKPEKTKEFFERLKYEIQEDSPEKGTITVSWEKVSAQLEFTNVN